jgi:hypothetical protein
MYLRTRICLAVLLTLTFVCNADAANPFRPFKGFGLAESMVAPHPTLPPPMLLFTAREIGNYTHFGKGTLITMSGDFDPIAGTLVNGKSVAIAADGSTANATWSSQLQPDGTGKALVIWSGGTKRFKNVKSTFRTSSAN